MTDALEFDKILALAAKEARLEGGKARVLALKSETTLSGAQRLLNTTEEAYRVFVERSAPGVSLFSPLNGGAARAKKGATLSPEELAGVGELLTSAAAATETVEKYSAEGERYLKEIASRITPLPALERDISEKIEGDGLKDTASEKLYSIRREIRLLNERIRARLQEYLSGEEKKFLQEGIVTMRGNRYVLPVKAEYKRSVKGFIHDRSATGATVFIEPEEILEMNNELKNLELDEREEVGRILSELSRAVGAKQAEIERSEDALYELDSYYARALYADRTKSVKPRLNDRGILEIEKGRHPLLDRKTAVPVTVSVGKDYDFLVISGANTGGKTVTLKMCGLFPLMAAAGLFVPAASARLAVFCGVYSDIGDSQSIEENLSTFSSHAVKMKNILREAKENSLVLIDEPGGGTDPEEGQALARAVIETLLARGAKGIVTTHYSPLKEYAAAADRVENGCMEFDGSTLKPLYRLKIGAPGASNALAICERLGFEKSLIERAKGHLSDEAKRYSGILAAAEEGRVEAEKALQAAREREAEWAARLKTLEEEERALKKEREKLFLNAKAEARRIVNERTARAEEIVEELEALMRKESLTEADVIRARTLKNAAARADGEEEEREKVRLVPVKIKTLKAGDRVFVSSFGAEGDVLSVREKRGTCEVRVGYVRAEVKFADLYYPARETAEKKKTVTVVRSLNPERKASFEVNLIGLTVQEALPELDDFLDGAVLSNAKTVRVVHGMGTGKLRSAVQEFLRKDPRVAEYRLGVYGEGESGVTIVTMK